VADDANQFRLGRTVLRAFERNDGAYIRADAAGYQFLLDFAGPSRFQAHSVGDVLAGRVPAGALQGRIVIVGVTAASVKDTIPTPRRFDHRGLELHALMVNQLLRAALDGEPPLRVWSEWQELSFVLLWCAAGSVLGLRVRKPWRLTALAAGCVVVQAVLAWVLFDHGLWIPTLTPAVAFLLAVGGTTTHVSHQQHMQRVELMRLFAKQVSPDVAEALWAQRDAFLEGGRPRPIKLTATVLFADIRGFTAVAERLEPHELMNWLNEFMETVGGVIVAHGGVVEKYIGDAIMAVFGIPFPRATDDEVRRDAANAVRCAFTMREALRAQNICWKNQGRPTAELAIGICSGPLVSGSLGSADRMEYTVLGDTVNIASRLESFEKEVDTAWQGECRVLVADSTRELLDNRFELALVGKIKLKGKAEVITVYRAAGERPAQER
jgi:adenylate cyclase